MRQRIDVLLSTVGSKMGVGGHLWCALARWPPITPLVSVVAARTRARSVVASIVIVIVVVLIVIVAVPP